MIAALRCPVCRSSVRVDPDEVRCLGDCQTSFPVIDGVPVLINEATSAFSIDQVAAARSQLSPSLDDRSMLSRLLPPLGRTHGSEDHLRRLSSLVSERSRRRILVIGGRTGGSGLASLTAIPDVEIVPTDIAWGPETLLICDAHDLPFADASFDAVVAQAVLEHVADADRCVREIHRVLGTGGLTYAETPFIQQVHGGRYDFARFTFLGHRRLFRAFEQISAGAIAGPGMALAWSWQYFLLSFASTRWSRRIARGIARLSGFWLSRLDASLIRRKEALDGASAFYFLGRRADASISDRELVALYRGGADADRAVGQWYGT